MTARKQRGEAEKRLRRNLERQGSPGPGGTIIQRSDEKDKKKILSASIQTGVISSFSSIGDR